jgi:hypothetical protein
MMMNGKEVEMRMKKGMGVVIAVVMAIVLIAFSSTASAESYDRTYTEDGGVLWYKGEPESKPNSAENISVFYMGEKLRFRDKTLNKSVAATVSGPYQSDGDLEDDYADYAVPANESWDTEEKTKGYFKVVGAGGGGGWFNLKTHSISVELVGEKEKVREKDEFSLRLKKNDRGHGVMKLTIEDDEGYSIEDVNEIDIYEALVGYAGKDFLQYDEDNSSAVVTADGKTVEGISIEDNRLVFHTSLLNMKEGKYKIKLEDNATEAVGNADIEVEEIYLEVECDGEVVEGNDIVIIIKSSFYEEEAYVTAGDDWKKKTVTLDEEGKKKVKFSTEDATFGTHKVTVEVSGMKETKYITLKKGEASLEELPEDATVGDIITLNGTSNFGDFAVFVIDDVFKGKARITDDEFEWDWDTVGEFDEFRNVEVFIVNESFSEELVNEDWQREEGVDLSVGIFLLLPVFSMTVPVNVAEEDEVVIRGSAAGTDSVYVIVINYKGEVMFPANGLATATPVEEGTWEETIGELDSGRYTVISVHKGKDDTTETIKEGTWAVGGEGKTLKQRVAILDDAISTAGSDDMYEKAYFTISAPTVSLKALGAVEIGDTIIVKAETNIRDGERVFVSLSQSPGAKDKTTVVVENGSVNTSINTSGLLPGSYNLTVDISGRASDEMAVILVEKVVEEEESEEGTADNESVTVPEDAGEVNESVGNETREGIGRILPVNAHDLLIAVVTAIFISLFVKQRWQRG